MTYPGYYVGKLLLAIGQRGEAAVAMLRPFLVKQRSEFWAWQLMAEALPETDDLSLACLLRAVHCRTPEHFLTRVRGLLATRYLSRGDYGGAREQIDFVADTMAIFKMNFEVELSTRPESYVGEIENWNRAEAGLKEAMDRRGMKYEINEGDGAFYGPKIDFKVKDAIGRTWQCATIQLDFNLPERFDIKYQDKDGQLKTPVMLHRVIFGSMERFHGILIEHYAGAFPLWLAPTQVAIVPISNEKHTDYAEKVYKKLRAAGIRAELDDRSESMNYKIREALQDKKIPYVVVVGDKEIEENSVAIRKRGKGPIGSQKVDEFLAGLLDEIKNRA